MNEERIAERVARVFMSGEASSKTATREYTRGCEADIAYEVVKSRVSTGWVVPYGKSSMMRASLAAQEAEGILAQFNIGYTDDMRGSWSYVNGGSSFFSGQ